jgi:hypothetical protein
MKCDLECRSERMCVHVDSTWYQYIWACKVTWWASPPHMDLSPHTRVYIWGGCWVSNWIDSGPCDLVLVYRFLSIDLWIFSGWCVGYPTWDTSMIPWRVNHLIGSAICQNLWKDLWDPDGACQSPLYTSNKQFSKSGLLAIFGLPWPMTGVRTAT